MKKKSTRSGRSKRVSDGEKPTPLASVMGPSLNRSITAMGPRSRRKEFREETMKYSGFLSADPLKLL